MLSKVQFKEVSWVPKCLNPLSLTESRHLTQCCECVSQKWLNCGSMLVICVADSLSHPFLVVSLASACRPGCSSRSPSSPLAKAPEEPVHFVNSMQLSGGWCRSWIRAPVPLGLFCWLSSQVACVLFCLSSGQNKMVSSCPSWYLISFGASACTCSRIGFLRFVLSNKRQLLMRLAG